MAAGQEFPIKMPHRNELIVTAVLFTGALTGVLCGYGLIAPQPAKNPPRILMATTGGPVLFPHRHHSDTDGPQFACADCHHNEEADADSLTAMNCRACHYSNPDIVETVCADDKIHPRCIGRSCRSCHEGEECTFCHRKKR